MSCKQAVVGDSGYRPSQPDSRQTPRLLKNGRVGGSPLSNIGKLVSLDSAAN